MPAVRFDRLPIRYFLMACVLAVFTGLRFSYAAEPAPSFADIMQHHANLTKFDVVVTVRTQRGQDVGAISVLRFNIARQGHRFLYATGPVVALWNEDVTVVVNTTARRILINRPSVPDEHAGPLAPVIPKNGPADPRFPAYAGTHGKFHEFISKSPDGKAWEAHYFVDIESGLLDSMTAEQPADDGTTTQVSAQYVWNSSPSFDDMHFSERRFLRHDEDNFLPAPAYTGYEIVRLDRQP